MPNISDVSRPSGFKFKPSNRLDVLAVHGNPADTLPTISQSADAGLEGLRIIKSTPRLVHIRIVAVAGSEVRVGRVRLNGNCFIRKSATCPGSSDSSKLATNFGGES
jgi:hypothetical protein